MRWPGITSYSLIGVDIGTASIKAVQLQRAPGRTWKLHRAVNLLRAQPTAQLTEAEASTFVDVLERQGFHGRKIALAAPGASLLVDVLDLPPRDSGAPIDALAAEEVARSHKLEPHSFCLAVWDLPIGQRGSAGASAMSVALRHADATAMLDPLERVGLIVMAIDSPAAALARLSQSQATDATQIRAILDIGCSAATLMLVAGDVVIYQRRMADAGLAALNTVLLNDLHIGSEEASHIFREIGVSETDAHGPAAARARGMILRHFESLNGEIEAGLQYAKHRHPGMPFAELLLAGGGATIRGADQLLRSRLDVPTRPLSGRSNNETATHPMIPVLSQAYGLALYGGE